MTKLTIELPSLSRAARDTAEFQYYQDGNLWYVLAECQFKFPIPVSDAGEGAFMPTMKGVTIIRWVRQHIELITSSVEDLVKDTSS